MLCLNCLRDVSDHLLATCTLCVSAEQTKDLRYTWSLHREEQVVVGFGS
ncbi:hypothetical protein HanXRQr2_Chr12g0557881 [Helianthus annuus]|uniref:Uncharacterized protein n=1 Tax=Helianthus annuus TaxID=4232 RepID=A0A9K3HJ63_HELAN|nr:hypothetical protein HanXRQr2_Chr12g0557881 [Helianthus annuus]KAJ0864041.1 hypothetical protein HanPSC8_Chr12g0537091 [Helianthus annuus]